MKVLIVGSGGREHALAWKMMQSNCVTEVYVAPGNAGTATETGVKNIPINVTDIQSLAAFAVKEQVGLTVVGPEVPLVAGIVDRFREEGLPIFGPTASAAQLEGSKSFAKSFMQRHGIPTAEAGVFEEIDAAEKYIHRLGAPVVVKADGLAAGKGVVIAHTAQEAIVAVHDMLRDNRYGQAGSRVVIEEFLEGEEASFIVMVDGETVLPLASSQDHKALYDGDAGPNTGGMGAYSPAPVVTTEIYQKIIDTVIFPTIAGMRSEGEPYTGFLYAGLMIGKDGSVKVLEYNCRLGDPETQPLLMRLQSDLASLCLAATQGKLHEYQTRWDTRTALGVVMAAKGYPDSYSTGDVIAGLSRAGMVADSKVFHAGTALLDHDTTVTSGGRVLCATSLGHTVEDAQSQAYHLVSQVEWVGAYYRTDIGNKALKYRELESLQQTGNPA